MKTFMGTLCKYLTKFTQVFKNTIKIYVNIPIISLDYR